jgi:hypothetical protein
MSLFLSSSSTDEVRRVIFISENDTSIIPIAWHYACLEAGVHFAMRAIKGRARETLVEG